MSALLLDVPSAVRHLKRDPLLAPLIREHGHPPFEPEPNAFKALAEFIIYQQLSGKAAGAIYDRFIDLFPRHRFPKPAILLTVPTTTLRGVGLSNQKASYLLDLAAKFMDGTIQPKHFPEMSNEEISAHLIQVKGIGQWTADMFLMFALNRPDILPVGDLGIRNGFKKLYGLRKDPSPERMAALAESWRPYRTAAAWYLWRALETK
jgi:DNA-3-methyladenine glycosylase II